MIHRSHGVNRKACFFMAAAMLLFVSGAALPAAAQTAKPAAKSVAPSITPAIFSQLKYRFIGPNPGNRTAAVCGVPGDMLTYYAGASSGGVFKSTNGGYSWQPIFDSQPALSIGALAIAFSDHNVVWAGTGEAWVRSNVSIGNGVYKSTDAGKTWKHMGLEKSGRIGRVAIDPRDPDVVFVAAMGHCYGPQKERGVYRTKDGGKTWEQVLFIDEDTGVFEIAMDFNNPRILFAGSWPLIIRTWNRFSGGPNGGIWKSTDGGDTWTRLTGHGLPEPPIGKVCVAIAQSNPNVVYALIETGGGGLEGQPGGPTNRGVLWRSNDCGENWQIASYHRLLNERPAYNGRLLVNPADEDEVYFAANSFSRTLDGGYDAITVPWGADNHDIWADPMNPDRLMVSNDHGGFITEDRGESIMPISLPIAQMYHTYVDNQVPYYVYGGMQDFSAWKVPSIRFAGRENDGSHLGQQTAGGENGFIIPDPVDPNIVWGGSTFIQQLQRADYHTGHITTATPWPEDGYASNGLSVKYRFNWTFPIAISPHDHNMVYVGSQFVHRTTDAGRSWEVISPDLTLNDPKMLGPSGGLTYDNHAVELGCCVFAIAESPLEKGCIWAGTNDGLVQITRDDGKNWTNVTKNLPNLPPLGTVSNLEPSRYDAGTCYITVDFHQVNSRDPYVYKTADYGKTWTYLGADIPKTVFSYCHWVNEDPVRKGMLFLGVENAIYISFNDGKSWLPIQNNLPHAPVHHMVVQQHYNDLVVGTYGRGFWIMDDITPLQQLTDDVLKSDSYLFKPRPAYRLNPVAGGPGGSRAAFINYFLKAVPDGPVTITVIDEEGREAGRLNGPRQPGINRVTWDMGYPGGRGIKLRTKPPGNPHVVEEKRFHLTWEEEGWFPWNAFGVTGGLQSFRAAPGIYTVKMSVGGKEYTQKLEVLKDPRSAGTLDDIKAQVKLLFEVTNDINTAADIINQIEWMRRQIADLTEVMAGKDLKVVTAAIAEFGKKLSAQEDRLTCPTFAESDNKSFRDPPQTYEKLSMLSADISNSVDFSPNKQQLELSAVLRERLMSVKSGYEEILKTDLPAFNKALADHGVAGISVPVVSERGGPIPDED